MGSPLELSGYQESHCIHNQWSLRQNVHLLHNYETWGAHEEIPCGEDISCPIGWVPETKDRHFKCIGKWSGDHIFSLIFIIIFKSTLMRSSNKEDLNIQSSLTSSLRRRSCRLPREQCSVTIANISQSMKNPKNGLTFSFRRSFIWEL